MSDTRIERVLAREVLDSRGRPTVEVDVITRGGALGRAIVPSGASTGRAEAQELRDGDPDRFDGRGVLQACAQARARLAPAVVGCDVLDQVGLDRALCEADGTPRKTATGANAVLGISLAAAHAAAAARGWPLWRHLHAVAQAQGAISVGMAPRLPVPMTNLISGGLHAGGNLDFQDFLISPVGARDFSQGLEWLVRVYNRLGERLTRQGFEGRLVGDEGGFGPRLASNREAVVQVLAAIEAAGLRPGTEVTLAIDVASSHFYDGQTYRLAATGREAWSSDDMIDNLATWVDEFPITSIEDGLAEEDWTGWQTLTTRLGDRVRLIGDDLFATHAERLRQGVKLGAANAVLIKPNQVGTLSETLETMAVARRAGYMCVVSARSGETEDTTIADLAVATAAEQIKIGSMVRGERLAKYNRLWRIAEELSAVQVDT